jgi:hypothetical protein
VTSNINPNNIDATYPVAGVDNDSQGFRTNFTNIKNALTYAAAEISDLQSKSILKSALSGGVLDNSMSGTLLQGAEVRDLRETRYDLSSVSGTVTLNHAYGHYHQASTSGSITLAFSNLPATGKVGRIRLELTVNSTAHTLTLPSAVNKGTLGIAGYSSNVITFAVTGLYIFEFTTDDAGATIHIQDLSRPRDYFHSNRITLQPRTFSSDLGVSGDVAGMFAVDTATPALWVSTAAYDGTSHIWRKAELENINNEVILASNVTTTNSSLSTITGMTFLATASTTYHFDVMLPIQHSAGATNTHTFSLNFSSGTCYALVQQQTTNSSAFTNQVITTSDATTAVVTTGQSATTRFVRMTGIFIASTSDVTVSVRHATNGGTLTILAGAIARFNRK